MHIEPSREAAIAFFSRAPEGPVVMLNLLRFREVADYSASPELAHAVEDPASSRFRARPACVRRARADG